MLGLPTETIKEMQQTVSFIKKYKPDAVDIKVYKPYPLTELYNYAIKNNLMKQPKTLEEWEKFSNLKEGEPNLSKIPTILLLKTINELSKTTYPIYFKKALLLILNGHTKYTLFKVKTILKNKLGLRHDEQKTSK